MKYQICKKENLKENYTSYKIKRIGILIYIEELKALLNKVSLVLKRERVLISEPWQNLWVVILTLR